MKRTLIYTAIAIVVLIVALYGFKQYTISHSPAAEAVYTSADLNASVKYCRPYKKNRVVFGEANVQPIQQYGKVWRTGANDATLITFSKNVQIGTQEVKAGTYSLYTIPNADQFTIIINAETGQWGTQYNQERDVVRVNVPVKKSETPAEQFTITLTADEANKAVNVNLNWDTTLVTFALGIK